LGMPDEPIDPAESAAEWATLTDDDWRARLTREQFAVLREAGTEPAGTGALLHNKSDGTYVCGACDAPLFGSDTKYESGSGWPSFFQPVDADAIEEIVDSSHGMIRTEIRCARCGSHLGHVFPDGPRPSGLRYCVNSLSLDFTPEG